MWRTTIKSSRFLLRSNATCTNNSLWRHLIAAAHHDDALANARRTRRFSSRSSETQAEKNNNRLSSANRRGRHNKNRNRDDNKNSPRERNTQPRLKARRPAGSNPKEHKYGSGRERTKAILLELIDGIRNLQRRAHGLELEEKLPPIWSNKVVLDDQNRREIFVEAKKLARRIRTNVEDGTLQPSGKHSHEVSVLLERILQLYSSVSVLSNESVYDECSSILSLMKNWKVDFQHKHCEYAATVAAHEGRWEDAAELFSSRIDPDSGYAPYDVSVSDPVGLYAIARYAQEHGTAVADSVFDAVLRMSMVSPSDQNKYILAAGTAIGHAGEWEAFLNYLQMSYNASQMGQTLVASVMHACILCHRHDEALQLYDQMVGDLAVAGEWQWGGGEDSIDPICRDLAMRALGGSTAEDASTRALELFREVEVDEKALSIEAICGVISACQGNGKWEDAIPIFFSVLDKSYNTAWLDSGDDLVVSDLRSPGAFNMEALPTLGLFLDSIMRACNSAGQFGVALLVFRLFELSLPRSFVDTCQFEVLETGTKSRITDALYPTIYGFSNSSDVLTTTMVSLCGLSCPHEAVILFEVAQSVEKNDDLSRAQDLYDFTTHEVTVQKPFALHPSWESSFRHMHRVTAAFQTVIANDEKLTRDDAHLLASALSMAINSFTIASQAEAGIILAKWVENSSGSGPIVTIDDESVDRESSGFLPITDSLLAAVLEAYSQAGRPDRSLELYEWHAGSDTSLSERPLTTIAVMRILFGQGRHDDAISLFQKVVKEAPSPDIFCEAAKGLVQANEWNAAADVYRLALKSCCVSEELSLLALRAVSLSRGKGRIRIMRNIIEEIARIAGTTGTKWTETKYWDLKRLVGFSNASRLMWWDDSKTSRLDELDLALQVLHNRASLGLTPKNDALRLVVASAKAFHPDYIPPYRTGLPRLPRDHVSWVRTLSKVLEQAELSTLSEDPKFVEDVALAFYSLRRSDLCIRVVNDALERGLRVNPATLNMVVEAADSSGSASSVDEIRMMVATETTIKS